MELTGQIAPLRPQTFESKISVPRGPVKEGYSFTEWVTLYRDVNRFGFRCAGRRLRPRGGPKEIVQQGRTGIVTPARSPGALVKAIETLIDDQDYRTEMGRNCRDYAETRSWDRAYLDFWNGS